jgi:hypothetical protein
MCDCRKHLEADEQGKIKEFIAKQKATIKSINFKGIGFPWIREADGTSKLMCVTLSILEVETNEKKRTIKVDIMHTFCPFCGVKYV